MRMPWTHTLSARLWLSNVVALALSLGLLSHLVLWAYERDPRSLIQHHTQTEIASDVARGLRLDRAGMPVSVELSSQQNWLMKVASSELSYRVLDSGGHILLTSAPGAIQGPWLSGPLTAVPDGSRESIIDGRAFVVSTLRIHCGGSACFVQTAMSKQFLAAVAGLKIKPIPRIVEIIVLIATIVFALALPLTIRKALQPLRAVSQAATKITPRNLKERLPTKHVPGEILPLIHAFNDALLRLEQGFEAQQNFLADAAHELQTPLTLMRGQIELQPEIVDRDLLFREIDVMARQVTQLLHLAEVRESQNFAFATFNAIDAARDAIDYLSRKADAKDVTLGLDEVEPQLTVCADRSALFVLLKNLLENAINVSYDGGVIIVRCDSDGLHVIDEGPGIRPEDIPSLFKRYWRPKNASYKGAGLGLSICMEIATAHGWKLSVGTNSLGSRFSVELGRGA